MAGKTALILGATGLVGGAMVDLLLEDPSYSNVIAFSRRPWDRTHPKLKVEIVEFENIEEYKALFSGQELYCCLGTTMKKAGSEEAFRKVDYEFPLACAHLAKVNGVGHFLIVTAMGSDTKSFFFYNRVKGEIERDLKALNLPRLSIVRPGLLLGSREENRWGESMAQSAMQVFSPLLPSAYKPISGNTVARAMIHIAQSDSSQQIFSSAELQELGKPKAS